MADLPGAYKVRTFAEHGKVIQELTDPLGEITRRVADVMAAQADSAFAAELIALGWQPPLKDDLPHDSFVGHEGDLLPVCTRALRNIRRIASNIKQKGEKSRDFTDGMWYAAKILKRYIRNAKNDTRKTG